VISAFGGHEVISAFGHEVISAFGHFAAAGHGSTRSI